MQEKRVHEDTSLDEPENGLDKEKTSSGAFYNANQDQHCNENVQPKCCRRKLVGSGIFKKNIYDLLGFLVHSRHILDFIFN